jgi:hypothetical protein
MQMVIAESYFPPKPHLELVAPTTLVSFHSRHLASDSLFYPSVRLIDNSGARRNSAREGNQAASLLFSENEMHFFIRTMTSRSSRF